MHVHACTYKHMCLSKHVYVCKCISVCVWICVCMCVFACMSKFQFQFSLHVSQNIICQLRVTSNVQIYKYFTSASTFFYSICHMNLANYNALLPLHDLFLTLQFTSHYNSLYLLFIILMTDQCLFCSHLDREIKLIWLIDN